MNEEYLKTYIHSLVANKTIFSNMLTVSFGASILLLIKALNGNASIAEIIFMLIGFVFSSILFYAISIISEKISNFLSTMNGEKKK